MSEATGTLTEEICELKNKMEAALRQVTESCPHLLKDEFTSRYSSKMQWR